MNSELRDHVIRLLDASTRLDGRKPKEFRKPVKVEYDVVRTAEGATKVTIGETEVIVGIKMEVGEPYPDLPDQGTIIVGAELLPLSNPDFELGPPGIQAIELARVVDRGIRESKAIDFKELCVEKGKKVWLILIDICTINDAGNLLDASALAALAAIKTARFPKYDGEKVDYKEKTSKKLTIKKEPIAITVCKIGEHFIVDPSSEEEKVIDSRLTVTSTGDETLCALQKGDNCPLSSEDIMKMIDIGIEKAKELRKVL